MATPTVYVLQLAGGFWYVGKTRRPVAERFAEHARGDGSEWTRLHAPVAVAQTLRSPDRFAEDTHVRELMLQHGIDRVRGGSFCRVVLPDYQRRSLTEELRSGDDACFACGERGHMAGRCPRLRQGGSTGDLERRVEGSGGGLERQGEGSRRGGGGGGGSGPEMRRVPGVPRLPARARETGECYRCGRTSHWVADCYASTDVNGEPLDDSDSGDDDDDDDDDDDGSESGGSEGGGEDEGCYRCGRDSHWVADCYAATDVNGNRLDPPARGKRPRSYEDEDEDEDACARCGRAGHAASNCYARSSIGTARGGGPYYVAPAAAGCARCGRVGHTARDCYARSDVSGSPL